MTDPIIQIHRILHKIETMRILVESQKRDGNISIGAAEMVEDRRLELERMLNGLLNDWGS